jgi:hypothetical protein
MHTRAIIASLALASSIVWAADYAVVQGKTYKFEKIAEGVYYATGGFGSNNVVIVNENDDRARKAAEITPGDLFCVRAGPDS